MGSHTWVRDEKKSGRGKTQVVGVPVVVPVGHKRKSQWKRDDNDHEKVESDQNRVRDQDNGRKLREEEAVKKKKRLLELKAQIEQKERQLAEKKIQKLESDDIAVEMVENEERLKQERRLKFETSFADAFESARESLAKDIKASKEKISFAGQEEIDRILSAKSDYSVLGLSPGADGVQIRKRYRQIAVTVHPDKCSHPKANEAFHKIVLAYRNLSRYVG
mmetsp:Transcript_13639/g.27245  ORF Transcript_13639/g.27245 Transcript_13639/m.27245 type:complete len:220 (-) Transcript_13639:1859-2518(-)